MTAPAPEIVDDAPAGPAAGWRGPILPVNTESGDGRTYLLDDDNELQVRPLPLPLCAQDEIADGHDGGRVVGRIDRVWVQDGAVWGEGTFDLADQNAAEWARKLSEGYAGWISADMDRTQFTQIARDVDGNEVTPEALATGESAEGTPLLRVSAWRLMGATLVSGPAFAEAKIEPADVDAPIEPVTAALTAAGIVYQLGDFQTPEADQPTALTVTEDGRVFGHAALWNSCHIGYRDSCVQPPRSASSYAYFHQGIVATDQGDLPVGKLTLGTGHAGLGQDARAAAAHYDNSGTAVCVVRASDGQHGIWLSGRVLPGVGDARLAELRRCGVSGDWRTIKGQMEMVAALCVNTPGFPVPRTEALAASGEMALVAAGVVANSAAGKTRRPCVEPVASEAAVQAERRRTVDRLAGRVFASELADIDRRMQAARLAALDRRVSTASLNRTAVASRSKFAVTTASARSLVADANPVNDRKAKPLERYWTAGPGLARWAEKPHPYSALVDALTKEAGDQMTPEQIKGLAARYFHKVFRMWPGERKGDNPVGPGAVTADGSAQDEHDTDGMVALLPSAEDAARLAIGDTPVDELHLTLAYLPDVGDFTDPQAVATLFAADGPITGEVNGAGLLGGGTAAVWLVNAPGLTDRRNELVAAMDGEEFPDVSRDFDGFLPHITYATNDPDPDGPDVATDPALFGPVTFDRLRVSLRGEHTDIPLGEPIVASAAPDARSTRIRSRRHNGRARKVN